MVSTWWQQRTDRKLSALARLRRRADHKKTLVRPRLEQLEDRLVPAVHTWRGAVSSSWSDARNQTVWVLISVHNRGLFCQHGGVPVGSSP